MNEKEKKERRKFAETVIERFNDQKKERLRGRPDSPPLFTLEERLRGGSNLLPILLPANPETRTMVEEHYKTNAVRSETGRVAFESPPVLLAPIEKED